MLSALGLFFVVLGVLQSGTYTWFVAKQPFYIGPVQVIPEGGISPVWLYIGIGAILLIWFFVHIRRREQAGNDPLLPTRIFTNRTSNLGLVTQLTQWLTLQGTFFIISVFLQQVYHFNAIQNGLTLLPAIIGLMLSSLPPVASPERAAKGADHGRLYRLDSWDAAVAADGPGTHNALRFIPGLFVAGLGIGVMLTISVNVVQSAFPEKDQGEISGLSRSISNLGSSFGTAIVGSILVVDLLQGNKTYGFALIVMVVFSAIGLLAAILLPQQTRPTGASTVPAEA